MASLIYIADPMCSWCYGFGPELRALLDGLPGLPLHVVTGGLRAYNRQPLDPELKATLQTHWRHVAERSGLPFADGALDHPGFVYDTEPACRAVVTARTLAPQAALPVLHAIQQAFYAQGRDVTRPDVLASVAAEAMSAAGIPTEADAFRAQLESAAAVSATADDFARTKRWGVSGFPTLVLERDGQLDLVTAGFLPMPQLVARMEALIDTATADSPE